MGTIKVGDTLPNFSFEDIDGKPHRLSEVVTDKTLITYVRPDCDACLVELERLKQAAKNQDDYDHVLLITSANPLHLQKLRADYGLGCVILYDDERQFMSTLKIESFPFNLEVNRQRVILVINAGTLFPDDYERFFEEARAITLEHGRVETPVDLSSRVPNALRGRDVAISNCAVQTTPRLPRYDVPPDGGSSPLAMTAKQLFSTGSKAGAQSSWTGDKGAMAEPPRGSALRR